MLCARRSHRGVVEVAVDALGVVAAPVEPFEVTVAGWDRSHVLRAVEPPLAVVVVAKQANGDGSGAVVGG